METVANKFLRLILNIVIAIKEKIVLKESVLSYLLDF